MGASSSCLLLPDGDRNEERLDALRRDLGRARMSGYRARGAPTRLPCFQCNSNGAAEARAGPTNDTSFSPRSTSLPIWRSSPS